VTHRLRQRLANHALICFSTIALTVLFMRFFPKRDLISQISIGTAYPAMLLTAAALLVGPLNVLRRKPNPISFDLRRDLGIWAGIVALAHTTVGLNVHLRGRMWLYFVDDHHRLRKDLFGFGNYTGLVAAILFALLLALSNDVSLRKLGASRWKSLQRWAYAAILLTAVHAVLYQQIEKRALPFVAVLYIVLGLIFAFQLAGYRATAS
jgi:methionine sulfoxide reductase heme-binding subunit